MEPITQQSLFKTTKAKIASAIAGVLIITIVGIGVTSAFGNNTRAQTEKKYEIVQGRIRAADKKIEEGKREKTQAQQEGCLLEKDLSAIKLLEHANRLDVISPDRAKDLTWKRDVMQCSFTQPAVQ